MKKLGAFLAILLLAGNALAATPHFPSLTGRVVDDAHVLNYATRQSLTSMLAEHEQATGQQLVVVTLPSLQGLDIADYGYQLGRDWGIGEKGKNTGVLFIVAPNERRVRIEVGYGLEGTLTDAVSDQIIQTIVLPQFRAGHLETGVTQGTMAILSVLNGGVAAAASSNAQTVHLSSNASGLVFALIIAALVFFQLFMVVIFLAAWIVAHLFNLLGWATPLNKLEEFEKSQYGHRYIAGPGIFYVGGLGGGGFSSGFSGGGGSFGGGGSSGSW